jgi:hypothetical protein
MVFSALTGAVRESEDFGSISDLKARRVPGEEAQTWRLASISANFTGGFQ